ncbi:1-aminocyclopropane-1-carboxylate deaminase/D-cysteine desulfhydrase [Spirosoma rhododendri]|uniref:1-aminocyclopropane-1-carboxylate deaminase/D-cysteine desulfhydrase n=1 Tax=Spirosoma rhododendri TaxID=2728024 RepID=A0A7L5DQI9_9BACT|nr:pyridoxal-phosphate dependent enzyme [Spirosoma rhododendri]QJD79483.1 1-aminocyclopropane-1-carboxylate deaminase/D-cysteine desulfhydrase [Spirosoma rhododendri]
MDELERQLRDLAGLSPLTLLPDPFPEPVPIRLLLKRDDQLHPLVSGNKWRKLKYNLIDARQQGLSTLLTFGGAYSNHLFAVAAAGQTFGFRTIGIVRGDELATRPRNPTLARCEQMGMALHFVSRADYDRKTDPAYLASLLAAVGPAYVLPEGGTNELAIQGTAELMDELLTQLGSEPDFVCCSVGTGGTVAGLVGAVASERLATQVLGFSAVGAQTSIPALPQPHDHWQLITDYTFGGYARTTPDLLAFIRTVEQRTGVRFEQVYTGKMLYGIYDLARRGFFPEGATVVAVHTGGLQGRSPALDE